MFEQIQQVVAQANEIYTEVTKLYNQHYRLEVTKGKTYHRIVRISVRNGMDDDFSRSAYGFVDNNGLLWKAASWKAPAKNKARGKLEDLLNKNLLSSVWEFSIQ